MPFNREKENFQLFLIRDGCTDEDVKLFLNIYVRCGDQFWKKEQLNEGVEWGWMNFSSIENLLTNLRDESNDSITFDIVVIN